MSDDEQVRPESAPWVTAIHRSESDYNPLGSGFVVDSHRILTCAHVVRAMKEKGETIWIAFPKAEEIGPRRIPATRVSVPVHAQVQDVAVLHVEESLPTDIIARLRCPTGSDLVGGEWWSFGFPEGQWIGNSSAGRIGEDLSYGWVRLDTKSRYPVKPGYSGAALWSPQYGAVVGLVGQASGVNGDACAFTLFEANRSLPDEKLRSLAEWSVEAAGEAALSAWGWTLAQDPEAGRHWRPRARGVTVDTERGFRFRGRRAALTRIVNWMGEAQQRKALVVTGSPGVGKSAVLGRIVTTADAAIAASLPAEDNAVRAPIGSIACAVHAKGKSALDIAREISRAASATLPTRVEDLPAALHEALEVREASQFIIVIDALDEAISAEEARIAITHIMLPIVETCTALGARVLVGSRTRDDAGNILSNFGPAAEVIDLDDSQYFNEEDLAEYARATLLLEGGERPGNPYASQGVAVPVAKRIAELSDRNFLVAGLVARTHGLYDTVAIPPGDVAFTPTVSAALREYLSRLPKVGDVRAEDVLAALAYAEAPGFSLELWATVISALSGAHLGIANLRVFSRSSAANFLIETSDVADVGQYRLFHQALNDALIEDRRDKASRIQDERAISRALIAQGRITAWERVPSYMFRSLPGHAYRGKVLDDLLSDDDYLLNADLRRLIPLADEAASEETRHRAQLIRKAPKAINVGASLRASLFSVIEVQEGLGDSFTKSSRATPYRALWATVKPRAEEVALEGHSGGVAAVASLDVGGRCLLASGSAAGNLRLSDPSSGETVRTLEGHSGNITSLSGFRLDGRTLLASATNEKEIKVWDPAIGRIVCSPDGENLDVIAMCALQYGEEGYLAIITLEGRLALWTPRAGEKFRPVDKVRWAEAICPVTVAGRQQLLCIADGSCFVVDPTKNKVMRVLDVDIIEEVNAVCNVRIARRECVAVAYVDETLEVFDLKSGERVQWFESSEGPVRGLCEVQIDGEELLAGFCDTRISIWNPASGELIRTLTGHTQDVLSICSLQIGLRTMLASSSVDNSVRLWDPSSSKIGHSLEDLRNVVQAVTPIKLGSRDAILAGTHSGDVRIQAAKSGRTLKRLGRFGQGVLSAATTMAGGKRIALMGGVDGDVYLVEVSSGSLVQKYSHHSASISAICPVVINDWSLVASGDASGLVCVWDPVSGETVMEIEDWFDRVYSICSVDISGEEILVCAGSGSEADVSHSVCLFNPVTGEPIRKLRGHTDWVRVVSTIKWREKSAILSGSDDSSVIIWDSEGRIIGTLEGHTDWVKAICVFHSDDSLLLATGGDDRTVRIWELDGWSPVLEIPVYHPVTSIAQVGRTLVVGSDAGLLGLSVNPNFLGANHPS